MQGLTCTAGAIPGALGVALVGIIFDRTHSWNVRKSYLQMFKWNGHKELDQCKKKLES
jgi:hypothetical protein